MWKHLIMIFISFPIRMGLGKKGEIHMAENAATLKCIRTQVLKFQSNWYVKLAFPALYAEMLIFIIYLMGSGNLKNAGLGFTSVSFVVALAIIVTIAYIQMKKLNAKLTQIRYLIFDADIYEKKDWNDEERSSAVEYVKDSQQYLRICVVAYIFAIVNLFTLSVLISSAIS